MRILFFDTETTGLPKNWNAPVSDLNNWPRLVQLAWQVYNEDQELLEEFDFIIKPNGFTIPRNVSQVHKITTEKANEQGDDLMKVLQLFFKSIQEAKLLIAHNYDYDYSVMASEFLRNGFNNILEDKDFMCTMKSTVDFCKIPGPYGYKWPKLEELYYILFNENFNAHNALDDIRATSRCFWELMSKKVINIPYSLPKLAESAINIDNTPLCKSISNLEYFPEIIEVKWVVERVFEYQKKLIKSISKDNLSIQFSNAGKLEHLIYLYYYVLHGLFWHESEIKLSINKTRHKLSTIDCLNWVTELFKFLIIYTLESCHQIGLMYSRQHVIKLIESRFILYKQADDQLLLNEGFSLISEELLYMVFNNPMEFNVFASKDGFLEIKNRDSKVLRNRIRLLSKSAFGLDNYVDLLDSLGDFKREYFYDNERYTIKAKDLPRIRAIRYVLENIQSESFKSMAFIGIAEELLTSRKVNNALDVIGLIDETYDKYYLLGLYCKNLIFNGEANKVEKVIQEETYWVPEQKQWPIYFEIAKAYSEIRNHHTAIEIMKRYTSGFIDLQRNSDEYIQYSMSRNIVHEVICLNLYKSGQINVSIEMAIKFETDIDEHHPLEALSELMLADGNVKEVGLIIEKAGHLKRPLCEKLVLFYLKQYQTQNAFAALNACSQTVEEKIPVLYEMVSFFLSRGDFQAAMDIIPEIEVNDQGGAYYMFTMGKLIKYHIRQGKLKYGISLVQRLNNVDDKYWLYMEMAIELMKIGRKEHAESVLKFIDIENDKYGNGQLRLSDAYEEFTKVFIDKNNEKQALKYLRLIQDSSRRISACRHIIQKYSSRNRNENALEFANTFQDFTGGFDLVSFTKVEIAKNIVKLDDIQ